MLLFFAYFGFFCSTSDLSCQICSKIFAQVCRRLLTRELFQCFGWLGDVIDILSIVTTLFGVCTSLGLGAIQINSGLHILNKDIPETDWVRVSTSNSSTSNNFFPSDLEMLFCDLARSYIDSIA